jgi:hypothetical protein
MPIAYLSDKNKKMATRGGNASALFAIVDENILSGTGWQRSGT